MKRTLSLPLQQGRLHGELELPEAPKALVLAIRARPLAPDGLITDALTERKLAVLHFALLTPQEAQFPDAGQNIPKLTQRLLDLLQFIRNDGDVAELPLGLLAIGEATPAALRAAARRDKQVLSLVCNGGLADRAGVESLEALRAPLLMWHAPNDEAVGMVFERASLHLRGEHQAATGTAADLATAAANWFTRTLSV